LNETTIHVDTILYLSLYYLKNYLVHLTNPHIRFTSLIEIMWHADVAKLFALYVSFCRWKLTVETNFEERKL